MDTNSGVMPPITLSIPTPTSPSDLTKEQQPDTTNTPTLLPPPPFANSIDELRSLSAALSTFLRRYDELLEHLNFIKTSIDSKFPNHLLNSANPNQSAIITESSCDHTITAVSETVVPEQNPIGTASNCERTHENVRKPESPNLSEETDPEEIDASMEPEETNTSKKPEETDTSEKPALSGLESFCVRMCGRDIKKYVAAHISDMSKLRDEVPKALKLAENPAKLVLESIGRFFLQGSKAYAKSPALVAGRNASVVILECFVMVSSDGIEIAKEEEEYAAKAAVDWRRRMILEGGLEKADKVDARGLLLLISGFGIPDSVFKNEDIRDLIKASVVKGISTALRRSVILIPRIPEVIDWMLKKNLEIEAANTAYTFGLEDKCHPQTILTKFLHDKIEARPQGSFPQVSVALKKQLSDLKSIRRCLKVHKLDPSTLLPGFKIDEKIQQLGEEINRLYSKPAKENATTRRRKFKETEPSKPTQHEAKRNRVSTHKTVPQEQKTSKLATNFVNTYPTSSASSPPGLPENRTSSVAVETGGGLARVGMGQGPHGEPRYRGAVTDPMANMTETGGRLAHIGMGSGPYGEPRYKGTITDPMANMTETRGGLAHVGMGTGPYGEPMYRGSVTDPIANMTNGRPYVRHENSALIEKYLPQPYSTPGLIGLYGGPSGRESLKSFPGLPSSSPISGFSARGGLSSDLYGFADIVVENEPYRGSREARAGGGTMGSSYLY